ncbi:hypothetical protein D3C71_1483160 [compost metagenome]
MDGRAGLEQAKLKRGLVRMLDGQPAVVAIAHIRVNAKAQFFDVERQRFVLIVHVQADNIDSFVHDSSLVDSRNVAAAARRRFSKTALSRSGRCAALTTQAGTRASSSG